ncbi:MAG: aminoacyl-tRNA hydrolase [Parcubacteria group bacterium]|nr:aminoacyl-tRNA hydrolase [Parcubacteria group bacterium]
MLLIVGLGNPGKQYANTRHNIAMRIIDGLSSNYKEMPKLLSQLAVEMFERRKVIFQKPLTFMNNSGEAVKKTAGFYKIPLEHLLIIHDDMDLPLGKIRFIEKGTSGGHKGVQSIMDQLGGNQFSRLKIGIGRPPLPMTPEAFVLAPFSSEEEELLRNLIPAVQESIRFYIKNGITKTMNKYNGPAQIFNFQLGIE